MIRRGIGVQSFVSAGVSTDADAQAFITAAGITDATQQSAINTLVTDLKTYGIWTKMKAVYPFVGGTSSTHKWNLINPVDSNAAYRLIFSGGWTHSSTGALPNGTNGYADTFLASSTLTSSSTHLSFYSRTDTASPAMFEMGVANFGTNKRFTLNIRYADSFGIQSGNAASGLSITNTNSSGFYTGTRTSTTAIEIYKNGISQASNTISDTTTLDTNSVWIGAIQNVGNLSTAYYSNRECAFASIGDGLTDTEAANLYTAVQAYQTTLSRNV
jgi:hypothetical protein